MSENPSNMLDKLGQTLGAPSSSESVVPAKGGWLSLFPEEIQSWVKQGLELEWRSRENAIQIAGFYRFGPMRLELRDKTIIAIDRKGQETDVSTFDALAKLNYDCWRRSQVRNTVPDLDRMFLDAFLQRNWVKRQWTYSPVDEG